MVDNYDIALAGLLHDIGKVVQRTGQPIRSSLKDQKSIFCKYNGRYFGYKHALYTVQFIEDNLKFVIDEKYLKASAKHHVPETKLEKIIAEADRLSAGMDRRDEINGVQQNKKYYINTRLYSIFQNINIGKENKKGNYYYKLVPLNISDEIFPVKETEDKIQTKDSKKEYANLLECIERDLKNEVGVDKYLNTKEGKEKVYNKIYSILEKYTTFIPSSTINYPDISLFDHLKTTSAIAVCLNEYYSSEEKSDNKFLLLEGDVSGIQNFIFQVAEGKEIKKYVAKTLRGRSIYINTLIDFMSKYIVKELGFTISNILYCGGGKFQLLLPNTKKVKNKIEKIDTEIQKFLYKNYKTKIGLVMSYVEINEEGVKNYSDSIVRLQEKQVKNKNQKFLKIIKLEKDEFFIQDKKLKNPCIYCHVNEANKEGNICNECSTHIQLGEKMVKDRIKYIVYDFDNSIRKSDVKVSFGFMGQVCFFEELNDNDIDFLIENVNGTGNFGKLKLVGNTVPQKNKSVASFNDIALLAEGDKKIAVLKMDIDNLGTIFSTGFKDENKSISRISTLSRMIDLFFCGYINRICEDMFKIYVEKNDGQTMELDNLHYINYSGGDDLLVIGPWDSIIELSMEIREKLSKFACLNPNVTISGGIYITDSKTPIRISLEKSENYLDAAKSYKYKDSIYVLGKDFRWKNDLNSIEKVMEDGKKYSIYLSEGLLSRGLAYSIMVGSKNIKRKGTLDFDLIPEIAYLISRNVQNNEIKNEMLAKLITPDIKDSEIESIKYPLMIALMKTRNVKED